MSKDIVTVIEKSLLIPTAIFGPLGWYCLKFDRLVPAAICFISIGVMSIIYITYLYIYHNALLNQQFNIAGVFIYVTFFSIFVSVAIVNVLIYDGFIGIPNGILEPAIKLDPNTLYQDNIPAASFSKQEYRMGFDIYVFNDVVASRKLDLSNPFEFRDWYLLCQDPGSSNRNTSEEFKYKELDCRVQGKRSGMVNTHGTSVDYIPWNPPISPMLH
jgi:hypothetical protein